METATYNMVHAALAPTEEILRKEFERQLLEQYDQFAKQLRADDMNAQVSFNYPNSYKLPGRMQYQIQLVKYRYCQHHTTCDDARTGRRGMNDPEYRLLHRSKSVKELKAKAVKMAKDA